MSDRVASYDGLDTANAKRAHHKLAKSKKKYKQSDLPTYSSNIEQLDECDENTEDGLFTPPKPKVERSHKRVVKSETDMHIPHDVLSSPILNSVAIRNKITPTKISAIIEAFI